MASIRPLSAPASPFRCSALPFTCTASGPLSISAVPPAPAPASVCGGFGAAASHPVPLPIPAALLPSLPVFLRSDLILQVAMATTLRPGLSVISWLLFGPLVWPASALRGPVTLDLQLSLEAVIPTGVSFLLPSLLAPDLAVAFWIRVTVAAAATAAAGGVSRSVAAFVLFLVLSFALFLLFFALLFLRKLFYAVKFSEKGRWTLKLVD